MTNFKIPLLAWKLMRSPIKSQREREEHYKTDDPVSSTNKLQGERKREREKEEGGEEGTFRLEDA